MHGGWHTWFGSVAGVVMLTALAFPLAAVLVWAIGRRRGLPVALADVGMVYGTVPFVWVTLLPGYRAGAEPGRVSLVPFRDLIAIAESSAAVGQIGGNLLVLAALGFFAPMRFRALASVPRILALAAGCSIVIETAQYVLRLDRVSSIDDVLLNAVGAALAAAASRRWWECSGSVTSATAAVARTG
ncbi:VanZ family protein [Cryptosporangium phraense]|uniref:VanZ family protein n=1 Tax=Cryptosporangium phraense TaxID=2593070 RepID=A0A545AS88_9ACTN|nr:VanZ family protein [Cryptosporangium phraense]